MAICLAFFHSFCPHMPKEERALLPYAYWEGSGHDLKIALVCVAIGQLESGQKVRKWFPKVKPNMDTMGTHNDTLFYELKAEGLITDKKYRLKSRQWMAWRRRFQERPDVGTMVASRAFARGARKYGLRKEIQRWKCQPETVEALLRLMEVHCLVKEMLSMYRHQDGGKYFGGLL